MDVMLIIPPAKNGSLLDIKWEQHLEFLGPEYILASLYQHNIRSCIVDWENLDLSCEQVIEIIKKVNPKIIGFSVSKAQLKSTLYIISEIRKYWQERYLLIGGYYPTLSPVHLLEELDEYCIAIIGEGEKTFLEVSQAILLNREYKDLQGVAFKQGDDVVVNNLPWLQEDLDELAIPLRETLDHVIAIGGDPYLISSRGCYGNCSYCSIKAFYKRGIGKKYRIRSIVNIVDEIEYLIDKFKISSYRIFDDNFFAGGNSGSRRVCDFIYELEKRGITAEFEIVCRANDIEDEIFAALKRVGLRKVLVGLEAFNQEALDYYKKNIQVKNNMDALNILDKYQIECEGSYIMFYPESTFSGIKKNYQHLQSRLKKEKGIGHLPSILAISTVLSIDEGTIIHTKHIKQGISAVGDEYQLNNKYVDKLKKAGIFLTLAFKNDIEKMVWLDKYFKKQIRNRDVQKKMLTELNSLWYKMAALNLQCFGEFMTYLSSCQKESEIELEAVSEKVEKVIDRILLNSQQIDDFLLNSEADLTCLPHIRLFKYRVDDGYIFYDLVKNTWQNQSVITNQVIYFLNQNFSEEEIIGELVGQYNQQEIISTYRKVCDMYRENLDTPKVKFTSQNKRYLQQLFKYIWKK